MKWSIAITAVLLCNLLLGCSGASPKAIQLRWILVDSADDQGEFIEEELMVFLQADDEDGPEDLKSLRIEVQDYYWEIPLEDLQPYKIPGEQWWGYNSLIMPMGASFPRGQYTAMIIDKAAQQGEFSWDMDAPELDPQEIKPARVKIQNAAVTIEDDLDRSWLILFYAGENFVESPYIVSGISHPLPESMLSEETENKFFILHVDKNTLKGWKQGPYTIN
ncbi:MAG: hypothetical protein PF447_14810 [Spirochaetaceae bacterium]|nr:hypothetical protein [Spirochaetaceae bacterium]